MNIVSFHKLGLQLVIQYLSIARITKLSEELRFFSANPIIVVNSNCQLLQHSNTAMFSKLIAIQKALH